MKRIPFALGCGSAVVLLACAPAPSQDPLLQSQLSGLSRADRLTSAEWSAYLADQQYIHSLVPPDVRIRFNHADPRQHGFVMARLKLAGKDARNSPYLFEVLDARREQQIARGLKAGTFAEKMPSLAPAARSEMHYIETASLGNIGLPSGVARNATGTLAVGTASSTFPGGSADTYVDVSISTVAGFPIAPLAYKEEFENPHGETGANVTISTSGDPNVTNIRRYAFESYKYEDPGDGEWTDSYVRTEAGSNNLQSPAGNPTLSAPLMQAPIDTNGDHLVSLCMDRAWTNDCDVILAGAAAQSIQVPLKGSIAITSSHVFNDTKINDIRVALNAGQNPPEAGSLKLVLANVGGGCDVTDGNTLVSRMSTFWNRVTLSADKRVFSWDLTGVDAAYFDDGCRQVQDDAKLTARIPLPLVSSPGGELALSSMTISNDPNVLRPEGPLERITLTNSCLAEGTQVQLADGRLAAIESLQIGQQVFNPYASVGHSLTITDAAKGSELSPMVRIVDVAGRTLLMTEMHPIATPDRGMVQARVLRAGDTVMTKQGPSTLTAVRREPYTGQVYNLKVGSQAETPALGQDQTILYANGFVVGDGQIQSKYESFAHEHADKPAIERVAERWRTDYLRSGQRH